MTPANGEKILSILKQRSGRWTMVELSDGRTLRVFDIAWGRDIGADFDHITTNISPGPQGEHDTDFFHTFEVAVVRDAATKEQLFRE
jgi:hypothetical protein